MRREEVDFDKFLNDYKVSMISNHVSKKENTLTQTLKHDLLNVDQYGIIYYRFGRPCSASFSADSCHHFVDSVFLTETQTPE